MSAERSNLGGGSHVPRVSVVMAAYNAAPYLEETIESILAQTYSDFELIIVDDGSTDETPQILGRYTDSRIVRLRNKANMGVARARNRGNAAAWGEYIAIQDADDLSTPDRLQKQVAFLDVHPEIGLVGSQGLLLSNGGEHPLTVPLHNEEIQALLLGQNCLLHSSLMIRKTLVEQVKGYDETYMATADYDLVLRIAELTQVANLPETLYIKRGVPGSITYSPRGLWQNRCALRAVEDALERRRGRGETAVPHPKYALTCLAAACAEAAFGETSLITRYVRRALEVDASLVEQPEAAQALADYAVGYALQAGAAQSPEEIIGRVFAHWPGTDRPVLLVRRTQALISASQAFLAYRNGRWKETIVMATRSLVAWPVRAGNRGLLSIMGRSLFRLRCSLFQQGRPRPNG